LKEWLPTITMGTMKKAIVFIAGLILCGVLAALVLWPGLDSFYVADDFLHLAYGRFISNPWRSFITPQFGGLLYRPLTYVLYFYQIKVLGDAPAAVHGTDLIIHALNSMLAALLAARLVGSRERSHSAPLVSWRPVSAGLCAGLVFGAHPVGALTAAWFACRADLVATAFSLATLLILAGEDKPRSPLYLLSGVTALLALLGKVTYLPLVPAAFCISFAAAPVLGLRERSRLALEKSLPVFDAAIIYIILRLLVLRGMGGYEMGPGSASEFFAMLTYSLPRVVSETARDLLVHDAVRGHEFYIPLVAGWSLLAFFGVWGALRRQAALLFCGVLLAVLFILPGWNLCHMFAVREERLVYFSVAGLSIAVAAFMAGPRHPSARSACLILVLFIALVFVPYSRHLVREWGMEAEENRRIADALARHIQEGGPGGDDRRIYVMGLPDDSYYLDLMIKLNISPAFHNRLVVQAERKSFMWTPAELDETAGTQDVPPMALPEKKRHRSDPRARLYTVYPPDLLIAAARDRFAKVLKWDNGRLVDMNPLLKRRFALRRLFLRQAKRHPTMLPTFSFRKTPLKVEWEAAGAELIEPGERGEPYTLAAQTNDPYLISPEISFPALAAHSISIEMAVPRRAWLPPGLDRACISWATEEKPGFSADRTRCFKIRADGALHAYRTQLSNNVYWALSDAITRVRLDPVQYKTDVQIARIGFEPAPE